MKTNSMRAENTSALNIFICFCEPDSHSHLLWMWSFSFTFTFFVNVIFFVHIHIFCDLCENWSQNSAARLRLYLRRFCDCFSHEHFSHSHFMWMIFVHIHKICECENNRSHSQLYVTKPDFGILYKKIFPKFKFFYLTKQEEYCIIYL
jgi:hypothetical protein